PLIHAEFARQTGQDMAYTAILAPLDGFAAAVKKFQAEGGKGLNVTVPFKLEAFGLLGQGDTLSERAHFAQAVNTIKFEEGGGLYADNTDGVGFVRDVTQNLRCSITGKRVLLMGAGGAARGVVLPILMEKPAQLVIANRSINKAIELAGTAAKYGNVLANSYEQLAGRQFDIVINATSSSLSGVLPPLPHDVFAPGSLAYDMMYGKGLTPFLQFAQANGAAHLADGLGMLVEQAAESFLLWRGVRPQTQSVITLLKPC
ncbi:MAG: shikimate dehydrogenase, partial [Sulfuricella sp.]|nr:shikimate dehydrogenase [Sulfuricella sp.]